MNKKVFDYYNSTYDFYMMSIKINPYNLLNVPEDMLTQEMCDEALRIDFAIIKDIPKRLLNMDLVRELLIDDPYLIKYVPNGYINKNLLNELLEINPNIIRLITSTYMNRLSNEKIINAISNVIINGNFKYDGVWNYIFEKIDKSCIDRIIDRVSDVDSIKVMDLPIEYLSGKAARRIVKKDPYLLSHIPAKFINQEMCNEIVLKYPQLINYIPKKFVNEELCMMAVRKNISLISIIPKEYMTKDLYMMVLSTNPLLIDQIPSEYIDKDMYKRIKVLLPLDKVVDLFNNTDKDSIKLEIAKDIWGLLEDYGSIEKVAKSNNISADKISNLIEGIKPIDNDLYKSVKNKVSSNQTLWISNVIKDGNTLIRIIESLGDVESIFLSREQKIKFAYLYNKNCTNSLEDIYTFANKYLNKVDNIKTIKNFFKRILKYSYLNEGNNQIPEKKTIIYNNRWLSKFDRDDYFKFKDGIPTATNKYLEHEITVDVVDSILKILKKEGIPLNDMIVKEAIREYYNHDLQQYVSKFHEYDSEIVNAKSIKK